jgi:dTDP-4-dehydrorhamnose reductase
MLKIAMTGGDGLVGSRIVELLSQKFTFINFPQAQMDITDKTQVGKALADVDFDIFLHLAAYTNVQGAETNPDLAMKINRDGTGNVFDAVSQKGKKFIYISTDFVFDGKSPPYFEDSVPHPQAVYAMSKYEGEKIVKDRAMIVRIAYPYRTAHAAKKDFVRTFRYLLEQKKNLNMVTDSLMTPTFIDDIAYGLKYLMQNYSPEIFHLVGGSSLSPFDATVMIAEKYNLDKSLIGKSTYEEFMKGKAASPKLGVVKSNKNNFWKMKTFEEGLIEIENQSLKI